jgi:methylase of polypeptide subunit release factors
VCRLDIMHHIYNMLLGGRLHAAPLDEERTQRILDVGTGTGIWAVEMADQFPQAEVIGTDLSPIQPSWYVVVLEESESDS